jgi:hypothetical protein
VSSLHCWQSHHEDMDGHVPPVRANMRKRLTVAKSSDIQHQVPGNQNRQMDDLVVPVDLVRIPNKQNWKKTHLSNTSRCGLFDTLGEQKHSSHIYPHARRFLLTVEFLLVVANCFEEFTLFQKTRLVSDHHPTTC